MDMTDNGKHTSLLVYYVMELIKNVKASFHTNQCVIELIKNVKAFIVQAPLNYSDCDIHTSLQQ